MKEQVAEWRNNDATFLMLKACIAVCPGSGHQDRDMFSLMWGPTVAAVSVVLDHAEDMATVRQALDGLLQAAKLGAYHHVDEVRTAWAVHATA